MPSSRSNASSSADQDFFREVKSSERDRGVKAGMKDLPSLDNLHGTSVIALVRASGLYLDDISKFVIWLMEN